MTESSEIRGESPLLNVLKTVEDYRQMRQQLAEQAKLAIVMMSPEQAIDAAEAIENAEVTADPWKVFADHGRPALMVTQEG